MKRRNLNPSAPRLLIVYTYTSFRSISNHPFCTLHDIIYLKIPAMYRGMKRHVALGVEKRYHLMSGISPALGPLQKHLHRSGRGIFRRFVDRIVAVVTRLPVIGAQVPHLQ